MKFKGILLLSIIMLLAICSKAQVLDNQDLSSEDRREATIYLKNGKSVNGWITGTLRLADSVRITDSPKGKDKTATTYKFNEVDSIILTKSGFCFEPFFYTDENRNPVSNPENIGVCFAQKLYSGKKVSCYKTFGFLVTHIENKNYYGNVQNTKGFYFYKFNDEKFGYCIQEYGPKFRKILNEQFAAMPDVVEALKDEKIFSSKRLMMNRKSFVIWLDEMAQGKNANFAEIWETQQNICKDNGMHTGNGGGAGDYESQFWKSIWVN